MKLDNNTSLKPQTDGTQPQIDIPEGGTIDVLNVRELDATLINTTTVNTRDVNAMNVEGQSIRGTVADVDKLAVQEEISLTAESVDISSYSQLLVLDEDGLVQKTTVDDVKTVLDDSFVTPSELTTALSGYVKNDTTNTTVTDFNNCPIGFISMPASSSNAPSSSRCYCLTQYYNNNNNYKSQIATVINTNDVYVRNYNNGTWSAWEKLVTQSYVDSYQVNTTATKHASITSGTIRVLKSVKTAYINGEFTVGTQIAAWSSLFTGCVGSYNQSELIIRPINGTTVYPIYVNSSGVVQNRTALPAGTYAICAVYPTA